jgi:hypothetical protein
MFQYFIPVRSKWKLKFQNKFFIHRSKQLNRTDAESKLNPKPDFGTAIHKPKLTDVSLQQIVLNETEYINKDIHQIQICTLRGKEFVSCKV